MTKSDGVYEESHSYISKQTYPISVYMGEQFELIPRKYMIFDRVMHGVIIFHPWRFGSIVNYFAGSWKESGDTIVITPYLLFTIWPDKGVGIDNDSTCSVRSVLFGDDSIHADLKFLIKGSRLVDITLDYVYSPQKPPLWEYELVYGSPIKKASKNYYALQEGMESETDSLRYDPWLYNLLMTSLADGEPQLHRLFRLTK